MTNMENLKKEKSERNKEISVAREAITALQGQRKELQNQKESANAEIAELTKKLQNGSISNKGERRNFARSNVNNALIATEQSSKNFKNRLRKSFNAEKIAKA